MLKLNPILLIEDIQNKIYELFHFRISKSFLSSILRYKCSLTRKKVKFNGKTKQNDEIVNRYKNCNILERMGCMLIYLYLGS